MIDPLLRSHHADGAHHRGPTTRTPRAPEHHGPAGHVRTVAMVVAAAALIAGLGLIGANRSNSTPGDESAAALVPASGEPQSGTPDAALGSSNGSPDPATEPAAAVLAVTAGDPSDTGDSAGDTGADDLPDLAEDVQTTEPATASGSSDCIMKTPSLRLGASGGDVECLQRALADAGAYAGALSGSFDQATFAAVSRVQEERKLFVDGVVGRETALSLGIWPDEEDLVIRTPAPPAGAVDLHGFALSSVASAGSNAPPVPENSGSGRRVVYDRMGQRVWAVDGDGRIIRSWLVSGSQYANELPGTHTVYSRSEWSTAWNGAARLPLMIRWLQTERGHIGFHGIPLRVSDGSAYQTEAELGARLSGGCQRQANRDAEFLWSFADIGTRVVVL